MYIFLISSYKYKYTYFLLNISINLVIYINNKKYIVLKHSLNQHCTIVQSLSPLYYRTILISNVFSFFKKQKVSTC